jgi:hypothetical protein
MDAAAENLLAVFHQNNLWRSAALLTTGLPVVFLYLVKIVSLLNTRLLAVLSYLHQNCHNKTFLIRKAFFLIEYI